MDSVKNWWDTLEAGKKRLTVIGLVLGVLVLLVMMSGGRESNRQVVQVEETKQTILADDGGAADLSEMNAKINVFEDTLSGVEGNVQKISQDISRLRGSVSAAANVQNNPEQTAALIDQLQKLTTRLEDLERRAVEGGTGGVIGPVAIGGGSAGNEIQAPVDLAGDPFSDTPSGSVSEFLDPLARIKGNLGSRVPTEPGSAVGGRRFVRTQDVPVGERPKIRIHNPPEKSRRPAGLYDPRIDRTAGAAGLSSRDIRGAYFEEEGESVIIPSGTLLQGVLLNGMDAPTGNQASSDPYPVTIRLTSFAFLPNEYVTDVKGCLVLAAGTGRLDSERVMLRTERLSCVSNKGSVVDVALEGYITGEDGKVGLRGTVVERTGALLARASLAGLGSGLSEALQPQFRNTVQTGAQGGGIDFVAPDSQEVLEVGAYAGAAKAMENISNYYLDRAEAIFPVIELDALRPVTVHISRGTTLTLNKKGYRETLEKES